MIGQKYEQHESMHGMLYDEMIQAILRVIHKLDLSSFKGLSSDVEVLKLLLFHVCNAFSIINLNLTVQKGINQSKSIKNSLSDTNLKVQD